MLTEAYNFMKFQRFSSLTFLIMMMRLSNFAPELEIFATTNWHRGSIYHCNTRRAQTSKVKKTFPRTDTNPWCVARADLHFHELTQPHCNTLDGVSSWRRKMPVCVNFRRHELTQTFLTLLLINLGQKAVKSTVYMKFKASSSHCKKTSWKYLGFLQENFILKNVQLQTLFSQIATFYWYLRVCQFVVSVTNYYDYY